MSDLYAHQMEICDKMGSVTPEGYHIVQARCARVGVQQYDGLEIGQPTKGVVRVMRPESSVFDTKSLRLYAWKPVTNNHPEGIAPAHQIVLLC